jgi:uncharacterized protein (DUF433 family)
MNSIREAEKLLSSMTRAEKLQLLHWVVRDLEDFYPGIQKTPAVCGGAACIADTRIPVWVLEQSRRLGMSDADILKNYPTLRAENLVNAWDYVRTHKEEIDEEIRLNEED